MEIVILCDPSKRVPSSRDDMHVTITRQKYDHSYGKLLRNFIVSYDIFDWAYETKTLDLFNFYIWSFQTPCPESFINSSTSSNESLRINWDVRIPHRYSCQTALTSAHRYFSPTTEGSLRAAESISRWRHGCFMRYCISFETLASQICIIGNNGEIL